jgi:hypothetical protein
VTDWDWVRIILGAPWTCWALAQLVSSFIWQCTARVYQLHVPRGVTVEHISQWVGQLAALLRAPRWWDIFPRWPICVELVATTHGVERLVVMPAHLRRAVLATLEAALPGARLEDQVPAIPSGRCRWVKAGELRLRGQQQLLAVDRGEETSRHVLAALQPLHSDERVRVQWLMVGARAPRPGRPQINKTHSHGITILQVRPPAVAVRWHQSDPVLSAVCRIGVATRDRPRARALLRRIVAALRGQNAPDTCITRRWLLPTLMVAARLANRSIPFVVWPVTVTSREIAGLLGLATGPLLLPGIPVGVAATLPPSPIMPTTGLVIAKANYPGIDRLLCLEREDRLRHVWVAGPTGVGKSTLLANLITYDIHRGDPVIVIDAGGDLITDVLARIPQPRHDDVIVLDPTSRDHVIGLNPIHSRGPEDHELAAGLIYHVLESVYARSWGDRTADIIRAGLLTLTMTCAPNGQRFTMLELISLLTNTGFRRYVISQPLTPALNSFWRDWYEALSDTQRLNVISPALNKLRAFSLYKPLRLMLGQSNGINLAEAMQRKHIVLVPLRTGLLGAETAALIGSLVMATVWQATLARATLPKDQRHPVWMYLDEFQRIVRLPIDLADMLAQARGFGLGLTLAHQYLDQLSPEIKAAVLGTARSQLIFQIEEDDATELAPRFAPLTRDDLSNLGPHEIALRPCVGGITLPPVTGTTYPLPPPTTDPQQLTKISLRRYGIPHTQIDQQIAARTQVSPTLGRHSNRTPHGANP